jgi:hypothetical protein
MQYKHLLLALIYLKKNMRYKLIQDPNTVLRSDGFFIERSNESDWSLYEAWLTGNTPDPADVSPSP